MQTSFRSVKPIADQAADLFYGRLFEIAPEVRPLFPGDLTEQKKKLMGMLATAVSNLHQVEKIVPAVEDLGRRHSGYGVTADALQACRRGAVVDAGEGARARLHAPGQGGVDRRLHNARLRHDGGGSKGRTASGAGAQGNIGPPVRLDAERTMQRRLLVIGNGMAGLRLLEELVALAPEPLRRDRRRRGGAARPTTACCCRALLAGESWQAADVELQARRLVRARTASRCAPVSASWRSDLRPRRNAVMLAGRRSGSASTGWCWRRAPSAIRLPLPGSDLAGRHHLPRSHDDIATMRARCRDRASAPS